MGKHFNAIRRAVLSLVGKDDKEFPESQTSSHGEGMDTEIFYPYGIHGNLPKDSLMILLFSNGQEENRTGMGYRPDLRPKELKEGEFVVGNFKVESIIKFLENGDIVVTGKNDIIVNIDKDLNVTVKGNATINVEGNVTMGITGNWTVTAADVTFNFDSFTVNSPTAFTGTLTSNGKDVSDDHTHVGSPTAPGGVQSNTGGVV